MCYYLYGSLYGNVSESEYASVKDRYEEKYGYKIAIGTKRDIKNAVKAAAECVQDDYRVTDWICDCESPVGNHDSGDPMIIELAHLITDLAALSGAEQINICLTWIGERNKKEITLKLKDVDLPVFLADMQENTLYSLNLTSET